MESSPCPSCGHEVSHQEGRRSAPPNQADEKTVQRVDCPGPDCNEKLIRAVSDTPEAVWHIDQTRD